VVDATMKTWSCPGCGTHVERPFAVCYNCGTSSTGEPDPTFRREVDAAEEAELQWSEAEQTTGVKKLARWQFTLRGLLVFVFVLCGLLAISLHLGPTFWLIVMFILVPNLLGILVALIVTYVFRIPNDGSIRWDDR
jgi:hypothetical protein